MAVFPIIFVTDFLKTFEKLSVVFYSCLFYIKLKAYNYPLRQNFEIVNYYLNNNNNKNSI